MKPFSDPLLLALIASVLVFAYGQGTEIGNEPANGAESQIYRAVRKSSVPDTFQLSAISAFFDF